MNLTDILAQAGGLQSVARDLGGGGLLDQVLSPQRTDPTQGDETAGEVPVASGERSESMSTAFSAAEAARSAARHS